MDRLWAAWRMAYITGTTEKKGKKQPCLFCSLARVEPSPRNLVLAATPGAIVMLNLYPYNVAHVMVAPRKHRASLADLTPEESVELTGWLGRVEVALKREYKPHGFNLGMNLGRTAGAGVLGHLHWHLVPRWNGDTNFMPVVGGVKVLPEALDRTYRRVSEALAPASGKPAVLSRRR